MNWWAARTASVRCGGPTAHPTFHPVSENVFPSDDKVMVRLPHPGQRGDGDVLAFEHQVLVHLVGDDDGVVGLGHRCHQLQLGTVEDAAHRVVWGVENDHPGVGADDAGQVGLVEAERRRAQRHVSCGRTPAMPIPAG